MLAGLGLGAALFLRRKMSSGTDIQQDMPSRMESNPDRDTDNSESSGMGPGRKLMAVLVSFVLAGLVRRFIMKRFAKPNY